MAFPVDASVAQWLARLERMRYTLLGPGIAEQAHELAALELEKPILIYDTAGVHLAAAKHACDSQPHDEIVGRDEATIAHVHEHHFQCRDACPPDDRNVARGQRRPVRSEERRVGK